MVSGKALEHEVERRFRGPAEPGEATAAPVFSFAATPSSAGIQLGTRLAR